jgi:hypothetical protein
VHRQEAAPRLARGTSSVAGLSGTCEQTTPNRALSPAFSTKSRETLSAPGRDLLPLHLVQVGRTYPDGTVELTYTRPPD